MSHLGQMATEAGKATAKALPCVSPHISARVELPQAYVVSGLCVSHYAVNLQTSRATGCLSLVIAIWVVVALFLKREDCG